MNSATILRALRKRWRIPVLTLIVALSGACIYLILTPNAYTGSAQIFVSTSSSDNLQQLAQGNTFVQARVQSYTSVATSPDVLDDVIQDLKLTETRDQLASQVTATAPLNKVLIDISVSYRTAAGASEIANAVAQRFSIVVRELEQTDPTVASPVKLTVTQPAEQPKSPSSPDRTSTLLGAVLAGIAVGVALAIARERLDTTVKTSEEAAEVCGSPVLGQIPFDKRAAIAPSAFRDLDARVRAESFRLLRTNLQFVNVDQPPRIVSVTSSVPGEGKTHTAINLAAALAEGDKRVCLIDADLRRPMVAKLLGLVSEVGLTSVLIGKASAEDVLQNAGANLAVLTSGAIPPNPAELLAADAFRELLEYIGDKVDYVVIDTAPVLAVADGVEVCAAAEATIFVVRAQSTTRQQIRRAIEALHRANVDPAGAVLGLTRSRSSSAYDSYSYYYSGAGNNASEASDQA